MTGLEIFAMHAAYTAIKALWLRKKSEDELLEIPQGEEYDYFHEHYIVNPHGSYPEILTDDGSSIQDIIDMING